MTGRRRCLVPIPSDALAEVRTVATRRVEVSALVSPPRPGAPSILLLHGLAADAALNWSGTVRALAPAFTVVAPDLRGHGRAAHRRERFTLEDATDDVASLVEALELGPCVVVGYSMGGAIAQLLCKRRPDLVRGLVLCATSASFRESQLDHVLYTAVPLARLAAGVVRPRIPRVVAHAVARHVVDGQLLQDVADHVGVFDVAQVLEACEALGRFRSQDWLSRLDVPSAVLVHLHDQLVPRARQMALADALSDGVIYPVDGDHFVAAKEPAVFVRALVSAVGGVVERSFGRAAPARSA